MGSSWVKDQNRKVINIACDNCGNFFDKALSEYKRNEKSNKHHFCCRSCAVSWRNKNVEWDRTNAYDISLHSGNGRDECTNYRYYIKQCKLRNREYDLDCEYLRKVWEKQKGRCVYTNIPIQLRMTTDTNKTYGYNTASLDRIDSAKGYIRGNVQFVSVAVNYAKSNESESYIKDFIRDIIRYK